MTTTQTIPESFPHDPERAADERARWLAVYGAAFALLTITRRRYLSEECEREIEEAERIADMEARARAAWEAEQVRKLDAEERP